MYLFIVPLSSTESNQVIVKQWFLAYGQSREVTQTLAISMFCHNVIFRAYSLIKIGSRDIVSCLNISEIHLAEVYSQHFDKFNW